MEGYDANGAPVEGEKVRRYRMSIKDQPDSISLRPVEHATGSWVRASEHLAAVQRLERENERITEMAAKHECDLIAAKAQLAAAKRDYAIMDETDKAYIKAAHAELASLRTQLSAATAARQWQPIETAPEDGEHLFWVVPREPDEQWLLEANDKPIVQRWQPYVFKGRLMTWNCLSKATHWMPLPDPPARREGSGES